MPTHPLSRFFEIVRDPNGPGPVVGLARSPGNAASFKCPECKENFPVPSFTAVTGYIDNALITEWSDHVGGYELIITERVLKSFRDAGISGFIAHPLSITRIDSPHLRKLPMPNLFLLEITGKINISREIFDENDGNLCTTCGRWRPRPGGRIRFGDRPLWPLMDSWDSCDFVGIRNINLGGIFCTGRVVELIRAHAWTGFWVRSFMPRMPRPDLSKDTWFEDCEKALHQKYPLAPDGVSPLNFPVRF